MEPSATGAVTTVVQIYFKHTVIQFAVYVISQILTFCLHLMTIPRSFGLLDINLNALFLGHTSLIYSVHFFHNSEMNCFIVTSSEDRVAKFGIYGECIQTIVHPGCVWSILMCNLTNSLL